MQREGTHVAMGLTMTGVFRWGGMRLARRLSRTVPVIGGVLAVAMVGSAMRRKGAVGGAVETGLNALPVVGTLKAGLEWWRGRDLIPDRAKATR
jgi:hypothetical protein